MGAADLKSQVEASPQEPSLLTCQSQILTASNDINPCCVPVPPADHRSGGAKQFACSVSCPSFCYLGVGNRTQGCWRVGGRALC